MMEQYRGPIPATDREYLVASYNLLASLTARVEGIDKDVERMKLYEFEPVKEKVDRHDWQIKLAGAIGLPALSALIVYALNHSH